MKSPMDEGLDKRRMDMRALMDEALSGSDRIGIKVKERGC
jgi:hypothetical protein